MEYNGKCKGDIEMARKNFGSPVEEKLQERFKEVCKQQGLKQNEVVEALMQGYVDGKIKISKKVIYEIRQEN